MKNKKAKKVQDGILKLTLNKRAFEVMVTGEKSVEIRKPSNWIMSRLVDKLTKQSKGYTHVLFRNGYSSDKPYFKCKYLGYEVADKELTLSFSDGLRAVVPGNILINLGDIVERDNIKT